MQPKIRVDFIVRLQIDKSNGTKPQCIPQFGFIDNDIKNLFAFFFTKHLFYVGN